MSTNTKILAPITYYGAKGNLSKELIPLMPEHRTFVDVFGGSGVVLLRKKPAIVDVYNDIDKTLVGLFQVLRNEALSKAFKELCENTPYSRAEFKSLKEPTDDIVEQARRTMARHCMSYAGVGDTFSYSISDGSDKPSCIRRWHRRIKAIPQIHERLKNVIVENLRWSDILMRYDIEESFFYLDPPYVHSTRTGHCNYRNEFTDADHEALVSLILTLKGKVMLSGYINPIYERLENAGWVRIDFKDRLSLASKSLRTYRTESVWMNYNPNVNA